jgi:putative FmdB family regulatory protein
MGLLFARIISIMPTYSYLCNSCGNNFEIVCSFSQYEKNPLPKCESCSSKLTVRRYAEDVQTINASVRKSDSELRTIGDIANRNRDRLSDDEKRAIYEKNNSYKEEESQKELPTGMTRMKKTRKTQWTDKPLKTKRKLNEKKSGS